MSRALAATSLNKRLALFLLLAAPAAAVDGEPVATLKKYCFQCHGKAATGGVDLEQLTGQASIGEHFQRWDKVATVLEEKRMPPPKMPQPEEERGWRRHVGFVPGSVNMPGSMKATPGG